MYAFRADHLLLDNNYCALPSIQRDNLRIKFKWTEDLSRYFWQKICQYWMITWEDIHLLYWLLFCDYNKAPWRSQLMEELTWACYARRIRVHHNVEDKQQQAWPQQQLRTHISDLKQKAEMVSSKETQSPFPPIRPHLLSLLTVPSARDQVLNSCNYGRCLIQTTIRVNVTEMQIKFTLSSTTRSLGCLK